MRYTDKLLDPRWQKKRLEIFQRDGFKCRSCKSQRRTLNVHHRWYLNGAEPWDYESEALLTLCDECHQRVKMYCDLIKESPEFLWAVRELDGAISKGGYKPAVRALNLLRHGNTDLPKRLAIAIGRAWVVFENGGLDYEI